MAEQQICRFNIRVYGLFIHEGSILITDEYRLEHYLTKFPGGGMHFGEGTIECLRRECKEEMEQEVIIQRHFYTTDYFQPTYFLPQTEQLLSIYYLAQLHNPALLNVAAKPFDFEDVVEGALRFRWIPLQQLSINELTLPIDKVVVGLLKQD